MPTAFRDSSSMSKNTHAETPNHIYDEQLTDLTSGAKHLVLMLSNETPKKLVNDGKLVLFVNVC